MIAAEQLKRRAYLVELDPTFCDVVVRRWEHFTGNHAKRLN
jgi:DNA modification methylase